tara:strand:+ start:4566 stop:5471 length:906 start_codon:yes stop_codon:yes gene_type:complete
MKFKEGFKEGYKEGFFDSIWDEAVEFVEDEIFGGLKRAVLDPITKFFTDFFNKVVKTFTKLYEDMMEWVEDAIKFITDFMDDLLNEVIIKPVNEIIAVVEVVIEEIEKLGTRFSHIAFGIQEIFVGIGFQFVEFGEGIGESIEGTGEVLSYTFELARTYLVCSVKYLKNLYKCIFYYIISGIGKILYLPIRIILWVSFTLFRIDAYGIEKQAWDGLDTIDTLFYELFGIHIIYFPKKIRDDCYTCIRLKPSVVSKKSEEVNDTISNIIVNLFSSNPHYDLASDHFNEFGAKKPKSIKSMRG